MAKKSIFGVVLSGVYVITAFSLLYVAGAGCEKKPVTSPGAPPAGGGTPAATPAGGAPAAGGGSKLVRAEVKNPAKVTGVVNITGTIPAPQLVPMDAKPECVQVHGGKPVPSDSLIASNGHLKDVFVYVKKGLETYAEFDVPSSPAVIDQKGCMYSPHVFGIQVKQDLEIRTSDPFTHNIKVNSNNPFNLAQLAGEKPTIKKAHFKKEEVPTKFACDVHSWMSAYACVVKHPYWAVTTEDGKFEIGGLPPGKYTIAVWHEAYPGLNPPPQKEVEVEVKENDSKSVDFTYALGG